MRIPRADVVGSLLRPAYLLEARERLERGDLTPPVFKQTEDRAVDEAVALQQAAGLDLITDGEMRRYAFYGHLVDALEGFDKYAGWSITFRDAEGHEAALQRPVVRRAARRDVAGRLSAARQRPRHAARRLHRAGQRHHRRAPRHDVRSAHLPRQSQEHVP